MHYTICFKNERGHTQRSEYTRFKTDADALAYGRKSTREVAMVEVWQDAELLARLVRDDVVVPPVSSPEQERAPSAGDQNGTSRLNGA